jgi:hypothetical protein
VREEFALGVANELNKRHENSPGMRAMAKHPFKEYFGNYFFKGFIFDLNE